MAVVYTSEQLKRLHEIEIEILKEIDRVCNELKIEYFADFGTLLGAVRHKGFIPWDDDIDICMLREDYDIFIANAPKILSKKYVLQHFLVDPRTPTFHAKVRKNGTKFVEEYLKDIPVHQGIFVDIFPYDAISEKPNEMKKYRRKIKFLMQLFVSKTVSVSTTEKNRTKRIINTVVRKIINLLLFPVSKKRIYERLNKEIQVFNKTESPLIKCSVKYPQLRTDIFPLSKLEFDGFSIPVPHNWDKVLKKEYGDYMKLPPKDKQYSHAPSILDLGE